MYFWGLKSLTKVPYQSFKITKQLKAVVLGLAEPEAGVNNGFMSCVLLLLNPDVLK